MAQESMPSEVQGKPGFFDRFADAVAHVTARAWFFAACVALVIIWLPSFFVVQNLDTWQLLINTPTTVVTFLLVGLAQNTSTRADSAIQQKLNAHSVALIALAEHLKLDDPQVLRELRDATGIEQEEGV